MYFVYKKDGTANNHLLLYRASGFFIAFQSLLYNKNLRSFEMKTKNMVMAAVLLAIGTVLHLIVPPIFSVTPDFLLATMFVAILFNRDLKGAIACGVAAGILAAMTTKFPGGQIPSIFDKTISAITFLLMLKAFTKVKKDPSLLSLAIMFFLNTVVSGVVFLYVGLGLATLSANADAINIFSSGMGKLILAVVLPTALANVVFGQVILNILKISDKRAKQMC